MGHEVERDRIEEQQRKKKETEETKNNSSSHITHPVASAKNKPKSKRSTTIQDAITTHQQESSDRRELISKVSEALHTFRKSKNTAVKMWSDFWHNRSGRLKSESKELAQYDLINVSGGKG